ETMPEADIARGIQEAIEESNIKHVKIRNVRKRPNHKVIVQCLDENEAELVRKLDWERAFPRLVGGGSMAVSYTWFQKATLTQNPKHRRKSRSDSKTRIAKASR